jgi:hypothetical protein
VLACAYRGGPVRNDGISEGCQDSTDHNEHTKNDLPIEAVILVAKRAAGEVAPLGAVPRGHERSHGLLIPLLLDPGASDGASGHGDGRGGLQSRNRGREESVGW